MTYKEIYQTIIDKETMLYQISPYNELGLPANAVFFKGRCGIGGSTLEMLQLRHSIITVPNVSCFKSKSADFLRLLKEQNKLEIFHPLFGVKGEDGVSKEAKIKRIEAELEKTDRYLKIMITTDSFESLIQAAKNIGKLQWLYDTFFLLLDECHSFITEKFRPNITIPFRYLWQFKTKCFISATPFEFSDPRFKQFSKHEIVIDEPLGDIELVEVNDIAGAVHFILTNPQKFPGNIHIFYNSIKELSDRVRTAIIQAGEINCNIYCSKSDDNMKKLGGLAGLFKEEPLTGEYKKFNIYTSKYNEIWDLLDTDATIILITDVKAKHTKVGITNKGVQAIGRLRVPPHRIIHFTNHKGKDTKPDINYYRKKHRLYAFDSILSFKNHCRKALANKIIPSKKLTDAAEDYAEISQDGYSAKLEFVKVDQWTNLDTCNAEYNNINFIMDAWKSANYNVTLKIANPESVPNVRKMLVSDQLKCAFEKLDFLERHKNKMLFSEDYCTSKSEIITLNKNFELMYKAYNQIGPEKIIELGFNKKAIVNALIRGTKSVENKMVLDELKDALGDRLPVFLSNKEAKQLLSKIYNKHGRVFRGAGTQLDLYCANFKRSKLGIKIVGLKHDLANNLPEYFLSN